MMMYKKMLVFGLALAISTIATQVTSAALIVSIERRNSFNTYPQIAGPLVEDALAFVDRTHIYVNIPSFLVGIDYVKVANDDKYNPNYELDVTVGEDATLMLFIDDRVGDNDNTNPPTIGSGVMNWVAGMGFVDTGLQIDIDENPATSPGIDQFFSIYSLEVLAGTTVTLLEQNDGTGRNMYGVAAIQGTLNLPPVVDAGDAQIIIWPENAVQLDATVTDDGKPVLPGKVTLMWSVQSSPDGSTVQFDPNEFVEDPVATFDEAGTYVLCLTADDSLLSESDCVTIRVKEPGLAIIYVDADATGNNDGSSWADAFNDLQDGLVTAWSDDEIRVAQGIYKPDQGVGITPGDRTATFGLINDVAIKGGYAGFGEPDPNARDPNTHETILSGDIGWVDYRWDNSYHVVTGSGTYETAVLDGFTITGGNANGYEGYDSFGGGMFNEDGSPRVSSCTFSGNSAELGGGMFNWGGGPILTDCTFTANTAVGGAGMWNEDSNATLTNCTFAENSADYYAGGVCNEYGNPTVTNCTFSGNSASVYWGGGMLNALSSPAVTNCTFSDNWAGEAGGGMWNYVSSNPTLVNCTFSGNSSYNYGGGMSNEYDSRATVTNCILWGNTAPSGPQIYNDGTSSATVSYSDVQGGWPGTGNINANPLFVDPAIGDYHLLPGSPCIDAGDNSAVPPSVVTDLDGNPRIIDGTVDMGAYEGPYSGFLLSAYWVIVPEGGTATFTVAPKMDPLGTLEVTVAVESGDPDITVESGGLLTFDSSNYTQPQTVTLAAAEDADELYGSTVILVSAPGVYPAGVTAYELDSEGPTVLYVDCDALGANDGSSWEDAFTELREGLSFAAGTFWVKEVRVAQGVYTPGDREATFQLKNGVAIKGGYAGFDEPDPNARDIDAYETILSGDLLGNDGLDFANNRENSYHVVTGSGTDATAVLDGFTITAGNANGDWESGAGGGMYNINGSPTVTNCTFIRNIASEGSGMSNWRSNPTLTNCIFSGNSASESGGGIYNYKSSPTLVNCTFSGNSADYGGGIGNVEDSSPTLTNCILWDNTAPSGPQIYNDETSSATVSYSDVQGGWPGEGNIDANPLFGTPGLLELIDEMGMVSYWKLDGSADDSAGDNDGTVYGNPVWTIGQLGGALGFDGAGDYVDCGNDSSLNLTNNFSISAWFNLNGAGTMLLICKGNVPAYLSGGAYTIFSNYIKGGLYFYVRKSNDAGYGSAITSVSLNEWIHVVGTFSDGNISIYKNGVFVQSTGLGTPTIYSNNGPLGIGAEGDGGRPFKGTIDEVAIHNRALSDEEIQQLYQIGLTGYNDYPLLPDSPCIDAGDPNYAAEPNETDLDGKPRVIGGRIDMGAYEFNHIPVADAGPDREVGAWPDGIAEVTLDGSGSYDDDGQPLSYLWSWTVGGNTYTATGPTPTIELPVGEQTIELIVNDGIDDSEADEVVITVIEPIEVAMKFTPQALNPDSKGNWVKAHFVLPAAFTIEDVDAHTPATVAPLDIESEYINVFVNEDGLVEIEAAFGRAAFCGAATGSGPVEVTVVGLLTSGQYFYGTDTIRIINKSFEYLGVLASHWLEGGCGAPDWCGGVDLDHNSLVDLMDFAMFDGCCIEVIRQ